MKDFIFLGGDLRFLYAAAKLNQEYNCAVYGFDSLPDVEEQVHKDTGVEILRSPRRCKNIVLPLPMSRNCDYITAPYHSKRMSINSVTDYTEEGATVYCGRACDSLREICRRNSLTMIDYFEREELIVLNAAIAAFEISPKPTIHATIFDFVRPYIIA